MVFTAPWQNDKETHKDKYEDKAKKGENFQQEMFNVYRDSCVAIYPNAIIFANTKTKHIRWDPSDVLFIIHCIKYKFI